MNKPNFHLGSALLLAGVLTATFAGTSCTAEDELEDFELEDLQAVDDDDRSGDHGHDGGDHHHGDHDSCEVETRRIEWRPPNHRLIDFDVEDCIENVKNCGHDCEVGEILWVESDEPANDRGDGNTDVDVVCRDDNTVALRRERSGRGDGRVYRIAFTVECEHKHRHGHGHGHGHHDHEHEHAAIGLCEVTVPHDRGQHDEAVWTEEGSYRVN